MTEKNKVLVVDDNDINAMLAAEMLGAFGIKAEIANSGTDAVQMIREQEFAFVLMDHIMPGMSGIETTSIIHGFSQVPIYAMTGDLNANVASEFSGAGAVASISKPLKVREIYEIIKKHVPEGSYRVNHELLRESDNLADEKKGDIVSPTLDSFLGTVTGLNYKIGLANSLGKEEGLLRLLKASSENIREYVKILSEYMQTGDPVKLKLASHSLKTVFANVGLESLRNESERIEMKATEIINDSEITGSIVSFDEEHQERINDYISKTLNAALELKEAISGYEQAMLSSASDIDYNIVESPLSEADMAQTIKYTATALERFEIDYIIEGLEILKKATCNEERKLIEGAIEAANGLDYDRLTENFELFQKGRT